MKKPLYGIDCNSDLNLLITTIDMKFRKLELWLLLLLQIIGVGMSYSQTFSANGQADNSDIISLRPSDIYNNPNDLAGFWLLNPIPLSAYTTEEIANQQLINLRASDAVVTYLPIDAQSEWTNIDYTEITPYTWKWVELKLDNYGDTIKISLRRPNTWILENKVDNVGNVIYLDWKEVGVVGYAAVTKIYPNQLDTRFWSYNRDGDYVTVPITGKFIHTSGNVYDLYVENQEPIGVTGNHPVWSKDRNGWVEASSLEVGERVITHGNHTTVLKKERRQGVHTVFNIEVYRGHTYFVSPESILVHNKNTPSPTPSAKVKKPVRPSPKETNSSVPPVSGVKAKGKSQGSNSDRLHDELGDAADYVKRIEQQNAGTSIPPTSMKYVKPPGGGGGARNPRAPSKDPSTSRGRRRSIKD